jgi:hypothetical protein
MDALLAFVRSHTGLSIAAAMTVLAMAMVISVTLETLLSARPGDGKGGD